MAHPDRQIRARRLEQQVVVVTHQAVPVADPSLPLDCQRELLEEPLVVSRVAKDSLPLVHASRDVIHRPGIQNTKRPRHDQRR